VLSGIAAKWAVRLGYNNVFRYHAGIAAWKENFPDELEIK
jgi:rhodanese-related sulfurtransferase